MTGPPHKGIIPGMAGTSVQERRLTGWQLWTGWLLWLAVVALVLLTLHRIWPENFWTTYSEWVVSRARPAVSSFMSYLDFVRIVTVVESASVITTLATGFLIFWRKSQTRTGLLVSATLILLAPWFLSSNMDVWRLPAWVPLGRALTFLQSGATILGLVLFLYLFPDGRFVPRWSSWQALFAVAAMFVYCLLGLDGSVLTPSTVASAEIFWPAFAIVFIPSIVIAGAAQVYRYRNTRDTARRQQTKWVVFGLSALVVQLMLGFLASFASAPAGLALVELILALLVHWLVPLTIGFAVLRYRLWDVDVWIKRTLVYGGLTLVVVCVYGAVVGGLALLLRGRAGPVPTFLATALVALLALPLRDRLQRAVNRLLYGERDDPTALLARLSRGLEAVASAPAAVPDVAHAIAQALRLPYVALRVLRSNELEIIGSAGNSAAGGDGITTEHIPLTYGNEIIGELIVAERSPGERLSPADRRALLNIARQAGAWLHAAQLTLDLQVSREQIVAAREEERRRLQRDLHDGLGPQLAAIALKAGAARNRLVRDAAGTGRLLGEIETQAQNAVGDIRRLVYELRPPVLDQLGLVPALREHAASLNSAGALEICIESDDLPPLPAATEVAAYRIAIEALTNASRHGGARYCTLTLRSNGGLLLEVVDDGRGIREGRPGGVGLASMRERAEELGGTCRVEQRPEGGTRVSVKLPLEGRRG